MPKYTMGPEDDFDSEPIIPKKPIGPYRGRTEVHNAVPVPVAQEAPNSPMSVPKKRSAEESGTVKRPTMQWPVASPLDAREPEEIIVIDDSEIEEKSGLKKMPVEIPQIQKVRETPQVQQAPQIPHDPQFQVPKNLQVLDFKHTPEAPQTTTTPAQISYRARNFVIAATVAGLGYAGYKGYEKLFPQGSDEGNLDWTSLKDSFIKNSKDSNTASGEIEVLPLPADMKEPSIIVTPNPQPIVSQPFDEPVKTQVKTEVKIENVDAKNVGLVKIDTKSLDKLPEGDYKKMYQGVGFYVNEVPDKSITALIARHLMAQAKTKDQKESYRTNLRRTKKGWLIYMRQLELMVEAQDAKGETVTERDRADYDYWIKNYKPEKDLKEGLKKDPKKIALYNDAKWLAGKYRRLAKDKKNSWEFKRYQEYLDLGTSLMEGLRELNPKVASVNDVQNWQQVRVADDNGHVLEYLLDTSKRMKLPVPEPLVVAQNSVNIPVEVSKPKSQQSVQQQQVVSGVIDLDVDLPPVREADLNAYQAVGDLEDVMFGAQKAVAAEDSFDNMFPWERFEVAKAAEPERAEKIVIDAENWPDSNDKDTKILAQTGAFAVDNGSKILDEKDLYAEYNVEEDEKDLYAEYKVEERTETEEDEDDFYAEYKVEAAPEVVTPKQGFFSKAVSKVKGWFSKK
ncbi:hypothetical protein C0416_03505 [bacterium]|nr:hypothetical protein [bacterium]